MLMTASFHLIELFEQKKFHFCWRSILKNAFKIDICEQGFVTDIGSVMASPEDTRYQGTEFIKLFFQ